MLNRLPACATRSRLEPFRELIVELRRRNRRTKIAQALSSEFELSIIASGVHDFQRRSTAVTKKTAPQNVTGLPSIRRAKAAEEVVGVLVFDASQPPKLTGGT